MTKQALELARGLAATVPDVSKTGSGFSEVGEGFRTLGAQAQRVNQGAAKAAYNPVPNATGLVRLMPAWAKPR